MVCGGRAIFFAVCVCFSDVRFARFAVLTFCGGWSLCFFAVFALAAGGQAGDAGGFLFFASFAVLNLFAIGGRFFVFFAVFTFGGGRAIFRRFRLAVSGRAMRAVLLFCGVFAFFFICGLRRAGVCLFFATFALAFRACVLRVLRCLRFAAGGRFSQFKVQTFGPQRSSKSAALE